MLQVLAYFAQFLFVAATFAQVLKTIKDGHSEGLSHGLIWMLNVGFSIMIYYVISFLNADPVMLTGYVGQLSGFFVITKYKYFPRKVDLPSAPLSKDELELFEELVEEETV